ncbi:MAG: hypothetical protein RBT49_04190 [Bacteroidales bacterium]|jgi:hypothetical protein|nr:hypothetical protein [Bacteroidales bacterium]
MKSIILLFSILFLFGCEMNRQDTISAIKECEDAGLVPVIIYNRLTYKPMDVRCDIPIERYQ